MTLRVDLSPEIEDRLRAKAAEQGLTPERYVQGMLENTFSATAASPPVSGAPDGDRHDVPAGPTEEFDDDTDSARPWRGVFALEYDHPTLFVKTISVQALPRWEPSVAIHRLSQTLGRAAAKDGA